LNARTNKQTNKQTKHLLNASMHIGAKVAFFAFSTPRKAKKRKEKRIQLQSGGGEMRSSMGPREIRNRVQTVEEKETRKWNFVLTRCRHARRATVAASQQKKKIP
jgi:hypothetical protein